MEKELRVLRSKSFSIFLYACTHTAEYIKKYEEQETAKGTINLLDTDYIKLKARFYINTVASEIQKSDENLYSIDSEHSDNNNDCYHLEGMNIHKEVCFYYNDGNKRMLLAVEEEGDHGPQMCIYMLQADSVLLNLDEGPRLMWTWQHQQNVLETWEYNS